MKVSVIVAVYNEEKYLKRCLDSLISQTLKDIEIIIVDDGSTDNTSLICDEYADMYGFIRVLHQKNSGQGIARNNGIQIATGDYIGFVDGDDWVREEMFEKLYDSVKRNASDIAVCDVYKIFDYEGREENVVSLQDNKETVDIAYYLAFGESNAYSWNKLYRRSLWDKFKFEKMVYEDLAIIPLVLASANKISYVSESLYYYFKHSNSTTTSYQNPRLFDIFKAYDNLIKESRKKYKEFIIYNVAKRILINLQTKGFSYYRNEFIELINNNAYLFLENPLIQNDMIISNIYRYINCVVIPKNIIYMNENDISYIKYYASPDTVYYRCKDYKEMLEILYKNGGVLIANKIKINRPMGEFLSKVNFISFKENSIACHFMGLQKESCLIQYLLKCYVDKKILNIDVLNKINELDIITV